jgi:hypothetical protein
MIYPLVRDLAADGIPVTVTCRVLGFSPQAFHKWRANPISAREWSDAHLIDAARQTDAEAISLEHGKTSHDGQLTCAIYETERNVQQ